MTLLVLMRGRLRDAQSLWAMYMVLGAGVGIAMAPFVIVHPGLTEWWRRVTPE